MSRTPPALIVASRIRQVLLILCLFLPASCQPGPDTQARDACAAGNPLACRQLNEAAPAVSFDDIRVEQVRRDVAAIVRGMQSISASTSR